jgi:peptidoglycan L-alanyl-D-glutamate endopeptidase CwlK
MSSRRLEDLNPVVADMCRRFLALCRDRGIDVVVTSTLRTEAEQLALFAQGRKSLWYVNELRRDAGLPPIKEEQNRIVTHVLTSVHQFGCAFDVCIIKDGRAVWNIKADVNENDIPDYEEIGKIGEHIGLTWGGRFKFKDYCHFEYTGGLTLEDLKAGLRPKGKTVHRNKEGGKVMGKSFWKSKTFWVNLIGVVGVIVQSQTGYVIDAEKQLVILGVINAILRFVTKEPITWSR